MAALTPGASTSASATGPEGLVARVQALSEQLDAIEDVDAREVAQDLVATIMEIYGDGLARVLGALEQAGAPGVAIRDALAEDPAVGSLLLIHDLYPVALGERVAEALASVRPYLASHGGDVELVALQDGVARLRLQGSCHGCPASAATLELAIEQALAEIAPDLVGLEVEGVAFNGAAAGMELPVLQPGPAPKAVAPAWHDADALCTLAPGGVRTLTVGGVGLAVASVAGTLLAYLDSCAACDASLASATLGGAILTCDGCGARFDLPRAGRSPDDDGLQLAPVPLLRDGEAGVRVALAA